MFEEPEVDETSDGETEVTVLATAAVAGASESRGADRSKTPAKPRCFYCKGEHWIPKCPTFMAMPAEERKEFASEGGLCFGCLRRSHSYRHCRSRDPSLLSDEKKTEKATTLRTIAAEPDRAKIEENFLSSVVLVEICHPAQPEIKHLTYALLDSQSDSCFVSDEVLNKLSPPTAAVELQLTTMGASTKIKSDLVAGLQMRGAANSEMIDLPRCYSRGAIPMNRDAIPRAEDLIQWDHLKEVAARLPEYRPDVSVGLLVGFNCPAVFIPRSCQQNGDDKPFAVNTALGWVVMGATGGRVAEQAVVHRTSVKDVKMVELVRAFDLEFQEPANGDVKVSQDDVLFEKRISESLHQLDDGRYEMDLPFRSEPVDVPNNRPMAMKRLQHLKKKLLKKPEFCARYQEFMTEMLTKGYAEIVDTEPVPGRVMYTPHHGVESASKPGKVRPVFDGGATFEGVSLNSLLLAGSEDPNNLSGVLCNFRDERIGFMCDVKAMFYQVRVTERHRDFLRFLWFAEGDPNRDVIECRMCVHVFGATSSPSCANVAFRQNAIDQAAEYGEEVVQFIQRQFYVDDGLGSRSHADQVVKLFTDSHDLCKSGGFHLCKFACNDPEVIARIPEELLGEAAKTWVVSGRDAPVQTSLGLIWDMIRDAFRFTVQQMMNQMTRRGMLSALCSIYDPLGLISPVILVGRLILQSLCGLSLSWDDAVPVEVADKWRSWYTELQDLEKISIPRCVRTVTSGCQVTVELHHFSDASTLGYGVCSYIRLTNEEGKSDVNLLYSKARVAPKKAVSIPRMELQGAVLAVKVAEFLQRELIYPDITHHFWCDSKVALGYIKNSTRRFQMYVANRVTRIRESSCPEQWSYVNTDENPADLASRGVSPAQLAECDLWWHGPIFVAQGISPDDHDEMIELSDDPEVKRSAVSCKTLVTEEQPLERLINRLSSWRKIVRVVAICRGFVRRLRARTNGDALSSLTILQAITVADIQHCEMLMVKIVQRRVFHDEYEVLAEPLLSSASRDEHRARKRSLKQSSKMYQLDAFVDEQGMIRVGGRLGNANVPYHVRHPLLLPRDHRATYLIASREHQKCGHLGRQSTLAHLRESGFWVISGRVVVDRCTRACILCKKLKAPCMEQKMADLPLDRTEDAPPFTYSGVDVFGPYLVKEGRSYKKRWVCIFVCMMIRCAHLEPLHALTTDSFLHAFRRFINRRGAVKMLRSDCGTNFVGAENEMQNAKLEMDEDVVKNELLKHECEWTTMKFNCPKASHMGGVWERPIASIKSVFNSILHRHPDQLNDEIFHTFLTEAEGIYNSRPITPVDMSDPLAESPLCPANLLTLKRSNVRALPGKFPAEDVYSRRHWRRVQHFRQEFMCRWRREFLLSLQTRKKWGRTMKNLEVDDLVLLSDDEKKREDWSLGLVTSVERNADDLVRKAKIRTAAGEFYRPIHKLVYLLSPREDPVDV